MGKMKVGGLLWLGVTMPTGETSTLRGGAPRAIPDGCGREIQEAPGRPVADLRFICLIGVWRSGPLSGLEALGGCGSGCHFCPIDKHS